MRVSGALLQKRHGLYEEVKLYLSLECWGSLLVHSNEIVVVISLLAHKQQHVALHISTKDLLGTL